MDTSVLLNFLHIGRTELLQLHRCDFIVTDHTVGEISHHYPQSLAEFNRTLEIGALRLVRVADSEMLDLFETLVTRKSLGAGECSAIALAISKNYGLAIDDRSAANQTQRLQQGLPDIPTADQIKEIWAERYRFRLAVPSFACVVYGN